MAARQAVLAVHLFVAGAAIGALLALWISSLLPFGYDQQVAPARSTYTTTLTILGRDVSPSPTWQCATGQRFNDCSWR